MNNTAQKVDPLLERFDQHFGIVGNPDFAICARPAVDPLLARFDAYFGITEKQDGNQSDHIA